MKDNSNYYEVTAKCGHVGKKHYIPIIFAVKALNGEEAAKKVREFPRVKHNHKDAIINVIRIGYERFCEIVEANNNDPYLKCHSKQEQNLIDNFEERVIADTHYRDDTYDKEARRQRISYINKKVKILEEQLWEDSNYVYAH